MIIASRLLSPAAVLLLTMGLASCQSPSPGNETASASLAAQAVVSPAPVIPIPDLPAPLNSAQATERVAAIPAARSPHYRNRVTNMLAEQASIHPGRVLFLGDSLTEGYPFAIAFPGVAATNHGIGGDNILGLTERLDIAAATRPSRIYLTIGTNNIVWFDSVDVEKLVPDYARLLDQVQDQMPWAPLTVLSIPPVAGSYAKTNPFIRAMNARIAELCAQRAIPYIDIYTAMADENGDLRTEYHTDGVHLTVLGYWTWTRQLRTDAELWETAKAMCERWAQARGPARRADKVDPPASGGNRGQDQLVVYTPKYGSPTTMTNQWGREAVVRDGVVESTGAGNSVIPADGMVISGHGTAAQWVGMNLLPGVPVMLSGDRVEVPQAPLALLPPEAQLIRAEDVLMQYLALIPAAERDSHKVLFEKLQALREEPATAARTTALQELVSAVTP